MELTIQTNGVELPATLTRPEGPARAGVVALHASHMGKRDFFLYEHLTCVLPAQGIAVLRYDRRPSRFPDIFPVPFADQAADAHAALALLRRYVGDGVVGLWGFSQGGWIGPR